MYGMYFHKGVTSQVQHNMPLVTTQHDQVTFQNDKLLDVLTIKLPNQDQRTLYAKITLNLKFFLINQPSFSETNLVFQWKSFWAYLKA